MAIKEIVFANPGIDKETGLRSQSNEFFRRPSPHNRHSGLVSMHILSMRRQRRRWRRILRENTILWNK